MKTFIPGTSDMQRTEQHFSGSDTVRDVVIGHGGWVDGAVRAGRGHFRLIVQVCSQALNEVFWKTVDAVSAGSEHLC